MGKSSNRSTEYFFTGKYYDDNDGNSITAIGVGGEVYAYGGNDDVTVGSLKVDVYHTDGDLAVKGASGYTGISKTGNGGLSFAGAAGAAFINHTGDTGNLNYSGAAGYNKLVRKGLSGDTNFKGAGGYNKLWHETNRGNLDFAGAGAYNDIDRTWFNRYQDSQGNVTFNGAGSANSISSRVESGNVTFNGAGADNHIVRKGKEGNIILRGAGASNRIERVRQNKDEYEQTRGDITVEGAGGYNKLYSDVAHGNINFSGAGAYNEITRIGMNSDSDGETLEFAKAKEIVLTTATMGGSWIQESQQVTGIKSTVEPNTYLFAFADKIYTKISKVQLQNNPTTGRLGYHATSWYKAGNHLKNLAAKEISSGNGFIAVNANGAYRLSSLVFEHQQPIEIHAIEESLLIDRWVTYAGGMVIKAEDISLGDAKMGGYAIFSDGRKVEVSAVKSNRQPNTYVYAKVMGRYTKIVEVQLKNDPETRQLKYKAIAWYKAGDHTGNLANEELSYANGYTSIGPGYTLSQLQYDVNTVRRTSHRLVHSEEYSQQDLVKSPTSSGYVNFNGAGGGNVIKSNVTRGNVNFKGAGAANVILHGSKFGDTNFDGAGAANVVVKSGEEGDLTFRGAGLANVLVHQSQRGKMDVYAGGAVNVLVRVGDGRYLAHLLAYGNISIHKGNGNSRVLMLGGYNTHTQIGNGNGNWSGAGGFNVITQAGAGDISSVLLGGANVLTKLGAGDMVAGMFGGANIITHLSEETETANTTAIALGGANILTKKGKGNALAVMGGGANVLTHIGDGNTTGVMLGGANILTKVGKGDTTGILFGVGNVLTHVGDGLTLGVMAAAGNIFTKVGEETSIAVMIGAGNLFTHVGKGDAWALMGGAVNVFTKVGDGNALALMVAAGNVFTHIGDGTSVALMLAKGNIATKVGNGMTLAAMMGKANIFTHVGEGNTFAAMIGGANVLTKVGNDLTAALMIGKANIYSHVGDGTSIGLFAGELNVMTKVGNGTTLAAMFGKANMMTHVGDGLTGVLALGEANIVTKVGDDFMGVVAAAKANVITHVGNSTTAAVLLGKGNILTKVGDGTTVGLLISDVGNVMTHVGEGTTVGLAKGKANLITKIGGGTGVNAVWGEANILTQVGNGDRYNFAKGQANIVTKVGNGQEVTVVQGDANIITHVGNGDDYTGAWGQANIITKIGDGRNVVLAKGKANIVTQVGKGDGFNALWSAGNVVTKVGDGMQITVAKGKANVTTTVGNGLSVTAAHGDANINTHVGDGVSVNVAWGKYNVNTKVGDGLNVAVMKGLGNANIQIGHGLYVNASYARNNVAIKIGDGDFYSLAVASSNTESNKLTSFFNNIKQTVLGVGGSQAINYLVHGDEANTSGTHKGRGAINLTEVSSIDGFKMDEIDQVGSDLNNHLSSSVTAVEVPNIDSIENSLASSLNRKTRSVSDRNENLIVNGNFEQGNQGWQSTNGVEAYYEASAYGLDNAGHGSRVSELDVDVSTTIYQDLKNRFEGEVISLSFDFAKRANNVMPNEGMEVIWNGESKFTITNGDTAWQSETLELIAKAGTNRIEFKGIGDNNGIGYILDNVVAKSVGTLPANSVTEYARQDQAAKNALSDKEKAEKDRQLLEQEKEKQLAAIEKSKSQLESTDQEALNQNGQVQSDAIKEEAQAATEELTLIADKFKQLKDETDDSRELDNHYLDYAGGISEDIQKRLDDIRPTLEKRLAEIHRDTIDTQQKVKDAVVLSEAGAEKGKQNRDKAILDGVDAQFKADQRKEEALSQQQQAEKAKDNANIAYQNAESRGKRDTVAAESKAAQTQTDAKGAKLSDSKPARIGASGSGLSGEKAYESTGAGETGSHIDPESMPEARNRYYQGLTEEELQALESAKQAVSRLQINAGIRAKNTGVSFIPRSVETQSDSIVVPLSHETRELVRKAPIISGINLEGLGGSKKRAVDSSVLSRAQKIAHIYRWLDNGNDNVSDEYIPVPGFKRVNADISDKTRQRIVTFVERHLKNPNAKNKVPENEITSLAKLFVDATLDYDWDKRVEFITKLDSYGYGFEPARDDKSIVSFWSGKSFRRHRDVLEAAQPDGKKIVYDVDVQGNAFAIQLNQQLMRWGIMYLADPENSEHKALRSAIDAATYSNTGFWSSIYAAGSRGDVYLISEGGLRLGNYFWNVELPVLRKLQREGLVGDIRLLDKPASEYKGLPTESIGRKLTEAGIAVQARFDVLTIEEQKKRLLANPGGYKADTVVDLDIKLSAIDTMLNQALPFYGLRTERNILVQKSDEGFEVRSWPGNGNEFKRIIVKNTTSNNLLKAVERFILANYDNYAQLPDELYFIEDRIISHHQGHTRILTEKVNGIWKPIPKLMSVSEFQQAASVAGKIRGDSYQKVIDALESYHNARQGRKDYELDVIGKLSDLRQQVEGYLLGHPDSGRVPAMKDLLSQIDTRFEESMVLAESTVRIPEQGDFSSLYDKFDSANIKDSKHLYIDENGDFVTRGKANIHINQKAESSDKAVEQVKAAVIKEYGQDVSDAVFSNLKASDLSMDGKGIDVSGLGKIHQAIEQHLSPISATLFVWKPSDHSELGHVAMQIGQGRAHINTDDAGAINEKNYVSWWPSLNHKTLEADVAFEEHDKFGLKDGDRKLQRFIEKLQLARGIDITFKDVTEGFAMMALANPTLLQSADIPEQIYQPFVEMWNDHQYEMADVGRLFAEELRYQADKNVQDPQLAEKRVANVIREFKERELENIRDFKISEADQGRVFRINLEGLDVAAMQAEWNKISSDPNKHYQLLTNNCSSIVARVLKAGGADKLVGHKWLPKFGTWTPTELFNYAQALQEAQLETIAKKQNHSPVEDLTALSGKNKALETVVMENDSTPLLNELITKDGLRKEAKVFAKPIGPSYQVILDELDRIHNLTGNEQLAAGFELYQRITRYLDAHPDSKRNTALSNVQTQLGDIMFSDALQEVRGPVLEIAQTRPEMALRIYQIARNEVRGDMPGLTDLMVRWVKEDPYLAAKLGYQGEIPADLAFNPKFHVDLGEQFDDFKQCLSRAQDKGLLTHARIDEQNKRVHLGYSYNELLDMTGSEDVKMAVYFLKEVAKQADPDFAGSHEAILLNRFANPAYLVQLEQERLAQIEAIYHSSRQTDVAAWDKQYSSDALTQLNRQLSDGADLDSQLSLLLKDRQGLLIGESHGSDLNGLRFVNEQMDALKAHGVTVIGLEHLRSDLAQPLIDKFLAGGDMSAELAAMIETKHLPANLFEQAKSKGIKIIALDNNSTTRPAIEGSQHGLMYRAGAANNVAVKRLGQLAEGEKFVAIYGDAHLQSHEGIDHFVPGMTHRLGLPALKVDANNRFTAQADDISLRKRYDDVADVPRIQLLNSLQATSAVELAHKPVELWQTVAVTPQTDGRETRFDGQIIIQMEDDPVTAKAAANLASKHPDSSVVVQLDSEGKYRVVYGDSSKFTLSDKLRWQIVGHGRSESERNNTRLSGYSADELAIKLKQFTQSFGPAGKPDHISIVGCSLINDDKRDDFARHFITTLKGQDIYTTVSARRSEVAVDVTGRKFTQNENNQWINNLTDNKVVLSWNEKGELETHSERVRRNIAESDINLSRVGVVDADAPTKGAIVENIDIFTAPEKRKNKTETDSNHISNNQLSYSGNIQVDVGNGEFTALNWGTSNVGIKVGTGGFKSWAFGDNNVMVHIGNGDSQHSVDIADYQALEGAQMFIGNRNISFNQGRSNDLIVMMDKSLPTPPLVNPFDGAARISGVLQSIAHSGEEQDWLAAQDQQWTIAGAKKFVQDMSGLDQTSSVDYKTLVDLGSQYERSSRGLRSDTEAALNKKFNQWLSSNDNSVDMSKMSRADKFRQANEKLAFNFAVGGQGADIQVTTGNWNFMFGDNIQSILDTNLGSLFSLMTQQYSTTGIAKTTFTYNPQDLPRQLKNKLLGRLASVNVDTTLADIFDVDYTADGRIVSRGDEPVDGVAILKEMIEVIGKFGGEQLKVFTDPDKLLDGLKSHLNMGTDGIKSFAESHGLKQKEPDENEKAESTEPERALGFHSLNLPNLFATMFSKDKQEEMKSLVTNLKGNLTADLLNMEQKTFDFLRNSGHLQGNSDIHVSLGNYNFNWGGDGKDLGAYLGDNNNFWGGRGDDVYYSIGTSNIFAGGAGNDLGVLMGRENWMFGGNGDDTAVVAGRINHVFMGEGNDQTFVFGEGGLINTDKGQDYVVTSGNYNRVDTGEDQDYAVTIGNNNRVELGEGHDFARVFGNDNQIDGNAGNDVIKLLGYHAVINGGEGDDHLIAAAISKFSQFNGGDGQDLLVLGGYQNRFQGGTGVDSFVVSGKVIDSQIDDINAEDMIVFDGMDWQNLWFQRSGYDLVLSVNRHTEDKTAQGAFESIGSVTFSHYFDGNRAKLVVQMRDKNTSGEREFTALSDNAVDTLIQSMSSFAPTAGDNGFIENLDSKAKIAITTAWADTTIGKTQFA
ncbi:MARTX multifunctional-autoprocessing repeats-in-toxin holotoxin RtxA [Photorhabdus bodei]|uniref:MARTX multifunctional-autoprocessing repeats-in-toxin holotoxin RtxA n=1 Tax=Photorhabdus bodei TaxID=2029681 RepID=A0AAW6BC53_9GAMM|nr:MARTX multifunctional-autoprocessing repeats-in-toxin holotoxin RtxA [Photorhabdus bodei]MDB6370394.1 MARTX multifunctional-autoprocessing repeats-in-toxin holotoxin RtxA [Photorhabdus bodei]